MTKTGARVKKQMTVNKNAIICPAEHNPRAPNMNAIIKRHEHVLQNNTVLNELFSTNLFTVANKRAKNFRKLVLRAACRYNIKTDLLD